MHIPPPCTAHPYPFPSPVSSSISPSISQVSRSIGMFALKHPQYTGVIPHPFVRVSQLVLPPGTTPQLPPPLSDLTDGCRGAAPSPPRTGPAVVVATAARDGSTSQQQKHALSSSSSASVAACEPPASFSAAIPTGGATGLAAPIASAFPLSSAPPPTGRNPSPPSSSAPFSSSSSSSSSAAAGVAAAGGGGGGGAHPPVNRLLSRVRQVGGGGGGGGPATTPASITTTGDVAAASATTTGPGASTASSSRPPSSTSSTAIPSATGSNPSATGSGSSNSAGGGGAGPGHRGAVGGLPRLGSGVWNGDLSTLTVPASLLARYANNSECDFPSIGRATSTGVTPAAISAAVAAAAGAEEGRSGVADSSIGRLGSGRGAATTTTPARTVSGAVSSVGGSTHSAPAAVEASSQYGGVFAGSSLSSPSSHTASYLGGQKQPGVVAVGSGSSAAAPTSSPRVGSSGGNGGGRVAISSVFPLVSPGSTTASNAGSALVPKSLWPKGASPSPTAAPANRSPDGDGARSGGGAFSNGGGGGISDRTASASSPNGGGGDAISHAVTLPHISEEEKGRGHSASGGGGGGSGSGGSGSDATAPAVSVRSASPSMGPPIVAVRIPTPHAAAPASASASLSASSVATTAINGASGSSKVPALLHSSGGATLSSTAGEGGFDVDLESASRRGSSTGVAGSFSPPASSSAAAVETARSPGTSFPTAGGQTGVGGELLLTARSDYSPFDSESPFTSATAATSNAIVPLAADASPTGLAPETGAAADCGDGDGGWSRALNSSSTRSGPPLSSSPPTTSMPLSSSFTATPVHPAATARPSSAPAPPAPAPTVTDEFVVLGSDGLFDVFPNRQDLMNRIKKSLRATGSADGACAAVVREAVTDRHASDNVSMVLIMLNQGGVHTATAGAGGGVVGYAKRAAARKLHSRVKRDLKKDENLARLARTYSSQVGGFVSSLLLLMLVF